MNALGTHLRNKMVAGALALMPIVIVIVIAFWLEENTHPVARLLGLPGIPGLGIVVALLAVYFAGVLVTSLVGGLLVRAADFFLQRIPGLNVLYRAWKDVLLLPPGKLGTYNHVVLVPGRQGGMQLGFTSGAVIPGTPPRWCVFVPGLPNPLSGQLVLYPCDACTPLAVTVDEAFKFLLSSGNYLPPGLSCSAPAEKPA
jgi:uncharacterized membrane protein